MVQRHYGESRGHVRDFDERLRHSSGRGGVRESGDRTVAVTGILSGVVLALGSAGLGLAYGAPLGLKTQTVVVVLGLSLGALVSLVSAFIGCVAPRRGCDEGKTRGTCGGDE